MDTLLKERRKAQRIPMNKHVKYRVLRRNGEEVDQEQYTRALGHDICEFGIGITAYEKFNPGDIVRVDFVLEEREIHAICEVAWCGRIFLGDDMYQYSAGMEFACTTEDERLFLKEFFSRQFESIWNYLLNPEK